jgi:hypothetical protein
MGLIEVIITTALVYSVSLLAYLVGHRLLWGDPKCSVILLKHLYYGQDPRAGKGAHTGCYEKGDN